MNTTQNTHFTSLNSLRGFAVLVVFLSHISNDNMHILPWLDFSGIGKSGVYLFFILSSFLLSFQLLKNSTNVFNLKPLLHYSKRRFFRIYPLFMVYLLCGLISTWVFSNFLGITEHAVPFPLSFNEFLKHIFLFDGKGVTWSIAVEFKFYIILPFLTLAITFLAVRSKALAFLLIIGLCILSLILFPEEQLLMNDTRLVSYSLIFVVGIFIASIQVFFASSFNQYRAPPIFVNLLSTFLIVYFAFSIPSVYEIAFPNEPIRYFNKNLLFFSFLWGLVLLFCINSKTAFFGFFNSKWLAFFGAISFSFYLIHPVVIGIFQFFEINTSFNGLLILCITTIISKLTYDYIEKPCLNLNFGWLSKLEIK